MSLLALSCRKLNLCSKFLYAPAISSQVLINRPVAYDSKKFPGFKVLYTFEKITRVSILNRIKYRLSLMIGVGVPIILSFNYYKSGTVLASAPMTYFSITTLLCTHVVGLYCNNVVGYIYIKPNSDAVKLSYVNYWGNRVDIETILSDITVEDMDNIMFKNYYKTLKIKGHPTLKLSESGGTVLDERAFSKLCGIDLIEQKFQ